MTLQTYVYIAFALLSAAFAVGGYAVALRQARKDVEGLRTQLNGVGSKQRALENEVRDRYTTQTVALMVVANAVEDHNLSAHVGEILNDPSRGK